MALQTEIKRKRFHLLSLLYLLLYAAVPRPVSSLILGLALVFFGGIEFIRLRRPEVNAWFLKMFRGLHRESEVLNPSGVFWTLLGCFLTTVIFTNKKIVMAAMGFVIFGDAAAALGGQRWGKHFWKDNSRKSLEGSGCFASVSALWALAFVRWPVAILGGLSGAWIEARRLPWNDGLWVPVLSGAVLSVLNLFLGR